MVYGAFEEETMHSAYYRVLTSPLNNMNLADCAEEICAELDRLLIEEIWSDKKYKKYI